MARLRPLQSDGKKGGSEPFLADLTVPEVRRLLEVALPLPYRPPELRLAWSLWRRAKRWQARLSHSRRQANAWRLGSKPSAGISAQLRL
ncbi:MAG: hypothetical protein E3J64_10120 [Anaerolineales bacterium]|nr:MAG: hypothetical protein E3J64_10120 [Anaerolineales bacterium]